VGPRDVNLPLTSLVLGFFFQVCSGGVGSVAVVMYTYAAQSMLGGDEAWLQC
jgi:hypothetical protein